MSRALVIVYSYTGTSRLLAQRFAAERGWPVGEIVDAKPRAGTARCVLDSIFRRRPTIRYAGPDPSRFDVVVLVSPIWMYRLAGPMRSFVAQYASKLPDVAIATVMGNVGAPNAVAEISALLGRHPLLEAPFLAREVEDGSSAGRVAAFARAVERLDRDSDVPLRPATWSPSAG